jgi:DNA-binding PadR family transcriptional regulator
MLTRMLADAGLVSSSSHGPRRLFTITEAGKAYLAGQQAELDAINAQLVEAAAPIEGKGIGDAIHDFRGALFAKMRKGALNADQAGKLRDLLERARREIEEL